MHSHILVPRERCSQHHWLVRLPPDSAPAAIEAFWLLLRGFAALGNAGAFVADDFDGSDYAMNILQERQSENGVLELLVEVRQCDIRYARPLRNAVFARGEMLELPVQEFRIESVTRSQSAQLLTAVVEATEVGVGRFYPGIPSRLAARYQKNTPPNYRSGRRAWVRCAQELSLPLIGELIKLVDLWVAVLDTGYPASEQELLRGETCILNVAGSQHDDVTFEIVVDQFIAAEAAFCSLMNLLVLQTSRTNFVLAFGIE